MDLRSDLVALPPSLLVPSDVTRVRAISAVGVPPGPRAERVATEPAFMVQVINEINTELARRQTGLRFVQHDALPRPLIQIVDQESGEVLRQIPNEAAVRIAQALTGLLIDHRA